MIKGKTKIKAIRLVRSIMRPQTTSGRGFVEFTTRDSIVVKAKRDPDSRRVGVYLRGGCDMPALFSIANDLRRDPRGTVAIQRDPIAASGSRSDLLLQSLDGLRDVPEQALTDVRGLLRLPPRYFSSDIFDPTFRVRGGKGDTEFDKTVIVLTAAPDFARSLYRHREYGFLVDPGGYWLNSSIDAAMADMSAIEEFNRGFRKVGRLSAEAFRDSFGRLVGELRERTGSHIVALNLLTIDPLDLTHSYRWVKDPDTARRRDFTIALAELSHELDFDVLDVDRILKLGGVEGQVDFAHFSHEQFAPIGREAYRLLREREIL